jgi:prepilin signal peptidase PulO-like enzyme (type II secretory pathway)
MQDSDSPVKWAISIFFSLIVIAIFVGTLYMVAAFFQYFAALCIVGIVSVLIHEALYGEALS